MKMNNMFVRQKWLVLLFAIIMLTSFSFQKEEQQVIANDVIVKEEMHDKIEADQLEEHGYSPYTMSTLFAEGDSLEEKIDRLVSDPLLDGAMTGVSVRHAETGEQLYGNDEDIRLRPASNMKLLTAITALETLGEDYTFSTELRTDGQVRGKVLQGNLYLVGKGDPTLLRDDFVDFAKQLKAQGIEKIKGNIVGDDTWYDDVRLSPTAIWSDEQYYYGSQVSALTLSPNDDYDTGTVIVEVSPAEKVGGEPEVTVIPENTTIKIVNEATTGETESERTVDVNRLHGTNTMVIDGSIPLEGSTTRIWRSVWEPTDFTLDVFRHALASEGVDLIGKSKVIRGETPDHTSLLVEKNDVTLGDVLIPFMKLSNNGHGEMLTKEMGRVVHDDGSWEKGIEVINSVLSSVGVNTETILIRDGSGISDKTLIPAEQMSQLLYNVQDKTWFPAFKNSLPVAGEPDRSVGGTLRSRMVGESTKGNVIAKTGSLTGVSSLSGYVTSADGEPLIFSMMMNNFIRGSMPQIQDAIATAIAEHTFEK